MTSVPSDPVATAQDRPHCDLCEAAPITPRLYEDELCWVAECESCWVPMVVWNEHDPNPPEEVRAVMISRLALVVDQHYGFEYFVDENMRTIPDHYHAHARRRGWPAVGSGRTAPRTVDRDE